MATTADDGGEDAATERENPQAQDPSTVKARRRRRVLVEWMICIVAVVLLTVGVRTFALEVFSIPTGSMEPTLEINDRIVVQKAFFSWHDVREGNIVVFTHPPRDTCPGPVNSDLVKRVIALGGQSIYSSGNTVYVDGRPLAEPYLPAIDPLGPAIPDASRQHPFVVPPGDFYVLGDNRDDSCDSRYWGPIKGTSIIGKAVLLLWHNGRPDFHLFGF
jgi:signal peptidase I